MYLRVFACVCLGVSMRARVCVCGRVLYVCCVYKDLFYVDVCRSGERVCICVSLVDL